MGAGPHTQAARGSDAAQNAYCVPSLPATASLRWHYPVQVLRVARDGGALSRNGSPSYVLYNIRIVHLGFLACQRAIWPTAPGKCASGAGSVEPRVHRAAAELVDCQKTASVQSVAYPDSFLSCPRKRASRSPRVLRRGARWIPAPGLKLAGAGFAGMTETGRDDGSSFFVIPAEAGIQSCDREKDGSPPRIAGMTFFVANDPLFTGPYNHRE